MIQLFHLLPPDLVLLVTSYLVTIKHQSGCHLYVKSADTTRWWMQNLCVKFNPRDMSINQLVGIKDIDKRAQYELMLRGNDVYNQIYDSIPEITDDLVNYVKMREFIPRTHDDIWICNIMNENSYVHRVNMMLAYIASKCRCVSQNIINQKITALLAGCVTAPHGKYLVRVFKIFTQHPLLFVYMIDRYYPCIVSLNNSYMTIQDYMHGRVILQASTDNYDEYYARLRLKLAQVYCSLNASLHLMHTSAVFISSAL